DDALVAVAAGHLVADRQLALHRDVHLDELDDAGRQLVAAADLLLLLLELALDDVDALRRPVLHRAQLLLDAEAVGLGAGAHERGERPFSPPLGGEHGPFADYTLTPVGVEETGPQRASVQQLHEPL